MVICTFDHASGTDTVGWLAGSFIRTKLKQIGSLPVWKKNKVVKGTNVDVAAQLGTLHLPAAMGLFLKVFAFLCMLSVAPRSSESRSAERLSGGRCFPADNGDIDTAELSDVRTWTVLEFWLFPVIGRPKELALTRDLFFYDDMLVHKPCTGI